MPLIYPNLFWGILSFLGAMNLTALLALALAICLILSGNYRVAQCWILLFGVTMAIVGASKLAFVAWGMGLPLLDFTGFSGHAARAAAVYPALFYTLSKNSKPNLQRAAIGAAFLLSLGVAVARVVWRAHSPSEAATGYLLGAIAAATYLHLDRSGGLLSLRYRFAWVAGAALTAILLPTAPTQHWIIQAGLALSGHEQPYSRAP
jgi:membrane-associated phospholipid phosphatase